MTSCPRGARFLKLPTLTKESLEQLRQKVDLVDLLSSYVELKRSGLYHKGCCPFHEEKTPSFVVQAGSSFYHCFGCQAHGDAIAFLMQHEHLSFIEAVEILAQRYQVMLEYDQNHTGGQNKKRFLEVLLEAHNFFHHTLLQSSEGKEALDYLASRGIESAFIKAFEIGLAPSDSKLLVQHLRSKNISLDEIKEVGLLNNYQSAFFYDRIMFPIHNSQGAVIAFSARLYKEKTNGGKYINSKESFLFKKSQVLYGLNYSRMRLAKGKKALIVEGQIDALRLIYHGLNATIAPLGTALTEGHVDKLNQLGVEEAFLAFDSDAAGENAMIKSGHLLQKKKIATYIVPMPAGYDPDSFLREKGARAFGDLLAKKVAYLPFLMDLLGRRVDVGDPAKKARLIEKVVLKIREWEDPVMVHESLKKVASIMQIPESTLGISEMSAPYVYVTSKPRSSSSTKLQHQYLETDLLTWLLQRDVPTTELLKIAHQNITPEDFIDEQCKTIYQALERGYINQNVLDTLSLLIETPEDETQKLIGTLLEKTIKKEDAKENFIKALQHILDQKWMKQREEIKVKIQSGRLTDDEAIQLAKEFDEIQKKRPQVKV